MRHKTIAILGVDGSGKSTAIRHVSRALGDQCVVQYMGHKDFEDPRIDEWTSRKASKWNSLKIIFLTYRCYRNRYDAAVASQKIVLFDRYVHEVWINSFGPRHILTTILYKYIFPQPAIIIYLHCEAEESMRRKADIPDPEVFRAMKKRFDDCFLNNHSVFSFDTGRQDEEEIAVDILSIIKKSFDAN